MQNWTSITTSKKRELRRNGHTKSLHAFESIPLKGKEGRDGSGECRDQNHLLLWSQATQGDEQKIEGE